MHEHGRRSPKRVLVVEDHHDSAQALCIALQTAGHAVEIATRGEGVIELAHRFEPEVVLCDLALPDVDGLELAHRIRADEQLKDVWLFAVSAYFVPALAFSAGFDEYVTKPADLPALAERLHGEPPERPRSDGR